MGRHRTAERTADAVAVETRGGSQWGRGPKWCQEVVACQGGKREATVVTRGIPECQTTIPTVVFLREARVRTRTSGRSLKQPPYSRYSCEPEAGRVIGWHARLTRRLLGGCIVPPPVVFHLKPQLLHLARTCRELFDWRAAAHARLKACGPSLLCFWDLAGGCRWLRRQANATAATPAITRAGGEPGGGQPSIESSR